jgi:hypothetical protein
MKKAGMEATKVTMKSQPVSDAVLLSGFTLAFLPVDEINQ